MEDDVLQQLLAVQTEILAELRLLRQAVAAGVTVRPVTARPAGPQAAMPPQATTAPQAAMPPQAAPQAPVAAPEPEPEPMPAEPPRRSGSGMMTMDELTELGGQFLEGVHRPKARTRPTDVADLGGSLLDEIKAKNRAKRDAFAEFDRLRRDR